MGPSGGSADDLLTVMDRMLNDHASHRTDYYKWFYISFVVCILMVAGCKGYFIVSWDER